MVAGGMATTAPSARAVLRAPGIARTYGTSLIARLPMGAHGLVLLLFVHRLTGSYALGGAASGAFALSLALSGPPLGRLIDRHGQTRVLVPLALAQASIHLALAAAPRSTPAAVLLAGAAAVGLCLPPMSAAARALWSRLIDRELLPAAYALEAAVLEAVYIAGPLVIVGAIGAVSLRLALIVNGACVLVGTLWFASSRQSRRWRGEGVQERHWAGPLTSHAVQALLGAIVLFGLAVGAMEVGIAAVTSAAGAPSAAGPVLAASGAGSLVGGLVAGRAGPAARPVRRFALLLAALAAGMVPWLIAPSPWWLGVAVFTGSVPIAPALATSSALIGEWAPAGTVTEAFTWNGTSLTAGLAAGSAATGALANVAPRAPLAIAVAAVALAAGWVVLQDARGAFRAQVSSPFQPQRGIVAPDGTTASVGE
jgi:MFS family permease